MLELTSNLTIDLTGAEHVDRSKDVLFIDPRSFKFDVHTFINYHSDNIKAAGITSEDVAFKLGRCYAYTNIGKLSINDILDGLSWLDFTERLLPVYGKNCSQVAGFCKRWNMSTSYRELIEKKYDEKLKKLVPVVKDWNQLEAVPITDIAKVVAYRFAEPVFHAFPNFRIFMDKDVQPSSKMYSIAQLIDARFFMKISTWPNAESIDSAYFAGFDSPVAEGFIEADLHRLLKEAERNEREEGEVPMYHDKNIIFEDRYGIPHYKQNIAEQFVF